MSDCAWQHLVLGRPEIYLAALVLTLALNFALNIVNITNNIFTCWANKRLSIIANK